MLLKLTDGVDDAAVCVLGAIQGSQVGDGLFSQTVLWKERDHIQSFICSFLSLI